MRIFFLLSILLITTGVQKAQDSYIDPVSILQETHNAIANAQTMIYRSQVWERMRDGSSHEAQMQVKVQMRPYKVYLQSIAPKPGIEILYDRNVDNGKALVNPNGFPWINVRLGINGKHMRDGNHHSVERAGLTYFDGIIRNGELYYQKKGKLDEIFVYEGVVESEQGPCHKVKMV